MKRKTPQRNVGPIIDHGKNRPHHIQRSTPYRRPVGKRRSAQWIGYPGRREGQDERLYPSRSSNQLEEATKERLDRKERRLENISKSFSDKPLEFWERVLLKIVTGIIAVVTLTAAIWIPIQLDSPERWGMRYYRGCNDPCQNDESLLSRKEAAFSDVMENFRQGKESRRQMKAFIFRFHAFRRFVQTLLPIFRGANIFFTHQEVITLGIVETGSVSIPGTAVHVDTEGKIYSMTLHFVG